MKCRDALTSPDIASPTGDPLTRDEIVVHYQPIVRLVDRRVVGFEALARWERSTGSLVGAQDFVPALIDAGRGVDLAERVMDEAAAALAVWRRTAPGDDGFVAVNVAAADLGRDGLPALIERVVSKHALPAGALMVEVGEDRIAVSGAEATAATAAMRAAGASLAADDYGTGYADAARLSELCFDVIKTDRHLAGSYMISAAARETVERVVALARADDIVVIAEGIEDEETASAVSELGCALGQGYLFGDPQPLTGAAVDGLAALAAMHHRGTY